MSDTRDGANVAPRPTREAGMGSQDGDVVARAKHCREWGNFDNLHAELLAEVMALRVQLSVAKRLAEADLKAERAHGDKWQKLAGKYDEIRYSLRNHDYTVAGCRAFYDDCCELIFGTDDAAIEGNP